MALKPMTEGDKNRILRNIGLVFLMQDIKLLNKYAYGFIHISSGFIAHCNLYGFIAHYGNSKKLAIDIIRQQSQNQWNNFHKGECDYEYMMQKKEIYNTICEFALQKFENIPNEEDCIKLQNVKDLFKEEPEYRKTIENAFRNHLENGNYFIDSTSIPQRVSDLADATMAYNAQVVQGDLKDNEFINKEIRFGENTGSICSLLECYRDEIWAVFNCASDRNFELGIFPDEDE